MKNAWIVGILSIGVILTALGVVYSKHQSRKLFVELDELYKQRDEMDVQWGKLQLEQSTLETHGRIENNARQRLNMINPEYENVFMVKPKK